jgi:hypothetical protein
VVHAQGAVHAQVVGHGRRVALGVLQLAVQRLALRVHHCVAQGVAHALRERALAPVLGGWSRQHALVRRRRVR